MNNEIIKEVRRNRTEMLESFGGDVEKMMRSMMKRQAGRGHRIVSLVKKKPKPGVASNAYPTRP